MKDGKGGEEDGKRERGGSSRGSEQNMETSENPGARKGRYHSLGFLAEDGSRR